MKIYRYIFGIAAIILLAGCEKREPEPRRDILSYHDLLKKASFAIYKEKFSDNSPEDAELHGSGVFVAISNNGCQRIFALTAAHVIRCLFNDKNVKKYQFATLDKQGRCLHRAGISNMQALRWTCAEDRGDDVSVCDITDAVSGIEAGGCVVNCIDLDSIGTPSTNSNHKVIWGVGVALRKQFEALGIGIGSDGGCIGANKDARKQITNDSYDWIDPFLLFRGELQNLNTNFTYKGVTHNTIVSDGGMCKGVSGSPQYVLAKDGCPYLIGIAIGERNGTHIIPIEKVYELIAKYYLK